MTHLRRGFCLAKRVTAAGFAGRNFLSGYGAVSMGAGAYFFGTEVRLSKALPELRVTASRRKSRHRKPIGVRGYLPQGMRLPKKAKNALRCAVLQIHA